MQPSLMGQISYPDSLPIVQHREKILNALSEHQVIVISGETGCGKTTQLPKMCLELLGDSGKIIGCTQPRRIAAISVADRVREELKNNGHLVGYKIRFADKTSRSTRIKFMTDGVLLAETKSDKNLARYDCLIIDEAHERSLNIDFLLGYVKRLLTLRTDLKVIITSATIDTEAFANHFDQAPVFQVSGRNYPVTLQYLPLDGDDEDERQGLLDHCASTVVNLCRQRERGDVLVFLPTEKDIRECCQLVSDQLKGVTVLPLFGRLSPADQSRVFKSHHQLKVVIATNVAETSITVPGIKYVVDSGLARISRYNVRAKTLSLPISRISQASCDQRKGRAGRVGPGTCIRLYSEDDYLQREEYTVPEIQRSNLAAVILQMTALELGEPISFPFLDPPKETAIREGYKLLDELGAIDRQKKLTQIGRLMADLPIDPCISRILIAAKENSCLREIKIIGSVLAIQDPRIRPADKENEADAAHRVFNQPFSDFLFFLNIWDSFQQFSDGQRSWSKLKKFCNSHYLSFQRMREWLDLHEQLERLLASREGFVDNPIPGSYEQIHRSLLVGFLRNIALKKTGKLYQGAQNKELMIFPGSSQFSKGPTWLLAAEFLETSKLFAMTVAAVEPQWIESAGGRFCRYSWSDIHWQKRTGRVMAKETVSLFGLVLSSDRLVDFASRHPKNQSQAREIFITQGLLEGEIKGNYDFLEHNRKLVDTWRDNEDKIRSRSLLVDSQTLHQFYHNRLPATIFSQATLNRYLRGGKRGKELFMQESDILQNLGVSSEFYDFPEYITHGQLQIKLDYRFTPGAEDDGITFRLPLELAPVVSRERFDWLVPGLIKEKVTYLLKGLPKGVRKQLVPVNETVDRLLDSMDYGQGYLLSTLESALLKIHRVSIGREQWPNDLPPHLIPRFSFFDGDGKEVLTGRDLGTMLAQRSSDKQSVAKPRPANKDQKLIEEWQGRAITQWDFADLPPAIPCYTQQNEQSGFLYPMLDVDDQGGCLHLSFTSDPEQASLSINRGMLFLYQRQFTDQFQALKKYCQTALSGPTAFLLTSFGETKKERVDMILQVILSGIFAPLNGQLVERQIFEQTVLKVRQQGLYPRGREICDRLLAFFRRQLELRTAIEKVFKEARFSQPAALKKKEEFLSHLRGLLDSDHWQREGLRQEMLANRQRYLEGVALRLERYQINPLKDENKEKELIPFLHCLSELQGRKAKALWPPEARLAAESFETAVEEFRLALFAPEIGTRMKVSAKRLKLLWQETLTKLPH